MDYMTLRTEAAEHVPVSAQRDTGLQNLLSGASHQTDNLSFPSSEHDKEMQLRHPEPSTGRRKRVRRIILKPLKLLGSAFKGAVRCCFRSSTQEMDGEVFVREHIVNGRVVRSPKEYGVVHGRAGGTGMNKEEEQDICRYVAEGSASLEVGRQSSESAGDECELSDSSDTVGEPSSAEACHKQSEVEGPASEDGVQDLVLIEDEDKTPYHSPLVLPTHGTDEEEQATGLGSGLSPQSFDEPLEQNETNCAGCEPEAAPVNIVLPEDRNDTELTLLGQTEAEFMEMVCSPTPFLDDEGSENLTAGEDSSAPVHSSGEESYWDSDHSSLAGSSSADEEWDEEVVVFSRASRLCSSAQRTVVGTNERTSGFSGEP